MFIVGIAAQIAGALFSHTLNQMGSKMFVLLILIIHNPLINLVYLLLLRGIIGCSTLISQRVTLKMLLSEYSLYKVVCIAQTDLVESKLQNLLSV